MSKTLSENEVRKQTAALLGKSTKDIKAFEEAQAKVIKSNSKKFDAIKIPIAGTMFTKKVAARKGGQKAINPFTKEAYVTKSKPASTKVKVRPSNFLKSLFS